jgi:site-specific DNA recombinase
MDERKGLCEMLDDIKKGDTVVVFKLDRLSRDIIEMVTIYRMIKERKAFLYSLSESNADDEFMMGIWGTLAQKERADMSLRIKAKMKAKRERRERTSRHIPYGYSLDEENLITTKQRDGTVIEKPGKLIPVDHEQEGIAHMIRYYDEGMTYREISQELAHLGYMSRALKPFSAMSIYRILAREGKTRSKDQPQEDTKGHHSHGE